MATAKQVQDEFRARGDATIAAHSARFFKTGKGEYGAGDRFLGIRVPETRSFAGRYRDLSLRSAGALLKSGFHEERLLAVLILVAKYERGDAAERQRVFDTYLSMRRYVNNWDLVDSSAHKIVGPQLMAGDRALLYELAASDDLWGRRIAIMSTYHFIREGEFADTLGIAELLIDDREDLIHKAVGWMLREAGRTDRPRLERFLRAQGSRIPRTTVRYAIEHFPADKRRRLLQATR